MNFTLLGQLIFAIEGKIRAAKESSQKYDFMSIKKNILDIFKNQIGHNREEYSKAISSHFGKLAAQRKKERKEARQKLLTILKEVLEIKRIQEARELELQELLRTGKIEISPDGDIFYLEEDDD